VRKHLAYCAAPGNIDAVSAFRDEVRQLKPYGLRVGGDSIGSAFSNWFSKEDLELAPRNHNPPPESDRRYFASCHQFVCQGPRDV
jgi:hypothetical protein